MSPDVGPLAGLRVVEIGSIGPGPFAAMLLADMGAEVVRLERPGRTALLPSGGSDVVNRGRATVPVDLKSAAGKNLVLRLVDAADVLVEGFRPGTMERLGLGPDTLLARRPSLVYGRITGYGQDGPLAQVAGHDINYIAVAGALGAISRQGERPLFPMNLLGDYGGGGMLLAFGVLCGVLSARTSGIGQVVDASMVDGVALLSTAIHGLLGGGGWNAEAGTNVLDSGAHFYEVYVTADGGHVAVGAIEPQFYAALLAALDIPADEAPQWDRERWPELKSRFAEVFTTRTRAEWTALLETSDACASPVLALDEVASHPHNVARRTFVSFDGVVQPAPAPRFSATPTRGPGPAPDAARALRAWGIDDDVLSLHGL